ncbi:MAG: RNA polymerase-binding protein DksA [Coxiellaceae bacterium]|nr:RNA polymerase-binding protein DksA [Coxiellaceae bacterium]
MKNESSSKVVTRKRTSSISLSVKQDTVHGPINIKPYLSRKHERYMNSKQLEHFRSVLLQWKNQLMQEINRAHNLQDEIVNYPDLADRASQEEEFNLELRARDREYKLLRKIDETLNRINDHDYGYCNDCGAEIGISRLEARPTTNQCVECKTIAEIRKRQIGDSRLFE